MNETPTELDRVAQMFGPAAGGILCIAAVAVESLVAIPLLFQSPTPEAPLRSPVGALVLTLGVIGAVTLGMRLISGQRRVDGGLFSVPALFVWGLVFLVAGILPPRSVPSHHYKFFVGATLLLAVSIFLTAYSRWRRKATNRGASTV